MNENASQPGEKPHAVKVWITAVRPFAYTASVLSVMLGVAVAYQAGNPILWGRFGLALLGVVMFHTAANLLNDCFDHRRGLDVTPVPTSGSVVRGWITEKQAFGAAMLCLAVGAACGLVLTWLAGWMVLVLGAVGAVIALGYTTARFCFKYNGLGDLAIFLAFGVLPVFGTYWVQAEAFDWRPVFWSVPLCSYTVAILHANNWRDIDRDREASCITPAVMFGKRGSALYYRGLILGPYIVVVGAILVARMWEPAQGIPAFSGLVLLSIPLAIKLARVKEGDPEFVMLDGKTAQLHMPFGLLLVIGLVLSRILAA